MNLQSAITTLATAFISLYLTCVAIGRPDIPWKLIAGLQNKAIAGTKANWGCPSIFNKEGACYRYDQKRYR